jgi:hypothetical protein
MLFRYTAAGYYEEHTKYINTLDGQNTEISNIKAGGTHNKHCALKD